MPTPASTSWELQAKRVLYIDGGGGGVRKTPPPSGLGGGGRGRGVWVVGGVQGGGGGRIKGFFISTGGAGGYNPPAPAGFKGRTPVGWCLVL